MGLSLKTDISDLIDRPGRLLLRAISHTGAPAVEAFTAWRSMVALNDADSGAYRILPLLAELVRREGLNDPDLQRLGGVSRHTWTSNVLKLKQLFTALDALQASGIRPVLLKGAALVARSPGIASKRLSGDYDILVSPDQLQSVRQALQQSGFIPKWHSWGNLGDPLIVTAGVAMSIEGRIGEIDLHWRPLWNIHDPSLTARFIGDAEERVLEGRSVLVPSATHHLFSALARCEPWDRAESFTRLVEGYFLLSNQGGEGVDWDRLANLTEHYGLEVVALAYCKVLAEETELPIPVTFVNRLRARLGLRRRWEWRVRALPPAQRSPWHLWLLDQQDTRFHRVDRRLSRPALLEVGLRRWGGTPRRLQRVWRAASRRLSLGATDLPRFVEGFWYPEAEGRWASGNWALMTVPLTEAQKAGAPVDLNAHVYRGNGEAIRVMATAGREVFQRILFDDETNPEIMLTVRPLRSLGGDGLLLLWLPDASSPFEAGVSDDQRQLGLFIRRDWQE